ncbi:hypothetical protein EAH89_02940 [Roseomonas nepalensis]|uniref:Uncharacterized protein n=1 Tax=Muricoccus nepalensis TaxID=1854500 RepID=A0A502GEP4_9PROT|nr:hypothetical protein [Roseomonas nepalensis]TPG60354.1 hypothetical protein EAH89_02940 [Roseomonas nepalensis]
MGDTRDGHGRKRGLPSVGAWAAMLTLWLPPPEAGAAAQGAARPVAVLPAPAGPGCLAPSAPAGGLAAPACGGSGTERPPAG